MLKEKKPFKKIVVTYGSLFVSLGIMLVSIASLHATMLPDQYTKITILLLLQTWIAIIETTSSNSTFHELKRTRFSKYSIASIVVSSSPFRRMLGLLVASVMLVLTYKWMAANQSLDTSSLEFILFGSVIFLRIVESIARSIVIYFGRMAEAYAFSMLSNFIKWAIPSVVSSITLVDFEYFLYWNIVASILVASIFIMLAFKKNAVNFNKVEEGERASGSKKFSSVTSLLAMGAGTMAFQMDRWILSVNVVPVEYSSYLTLAALGALIPFLVNPVVNRFIPLLLSSFEITDKKSKELLLSKASVYFAVISAIAGIGIFIMTPVLFGYFGKPLLTDSVSIDVFAIIVIAFYINGISHTSYVVFVITGNMYRLLIQNIVALCMGVLIYLLLDVDSSLKAAIVLFVVAFSHMFVGGVLNCAIRYKYSFSIYGLPVIFVSSTFVGVVFAYATILKLIDGVNVYSTVYNNIILIACLISLSIALFSGVLRNIRDSFFK